MSPSTPSPSRNLSRRERQIMDILYLRGASTVADVMDRLSDGPGYSAVRALLRILEQKGQVTHEKSGPRFIYSPSVPRKEASKHAIKHTLSTFFHGSVSDAVTALLDASEPSLDQDELSRLEVMIRDRRKSGE